MAFASKKRMEISTGPWRILWLTGLLMLSACGPTDTQEPTSEVAPADTWFPLTLGGQDIRVQLALTEEERQRGLMERETMAENDGMLFLFERPSRQSFWMYNTPLPLSIGYFTPDGVLREIYWMYPHDRSSVVSRRRDLQFALEMNQAWFKQNGVKPGAQIDLTQLSEAVSKRGFEPERFGLKQSTP